MNQQIEMYVGGGDFDIPTVKAFHGELPDKWIGFNYALQCKDPQNTGVHFFIEDYQFERVWSNPRRYAEMLRRFKAVIQPDFSLYRDFPKALNIYNLFRNCWLANYWTDNGVKVIPKPSYCNYDSHHWCFQTFEQGGVIATSSVGMMYFEEDFRYFIDGYNKMLNVIKPETILFYGVVPDECTGNIIHIRSYQEKMHEGRKKKT